jgi:shikimate kinase/3-dehydroquinate synthase
MTPPRSIVLVGFMGTGKSAIARELATLLGRECVDLDAVIAEEAGRSIAAVFADEGEAGFRARERAAVARVASRPGLVIAAGGGAVIDPQNRAALMADAEVVLLTASPDVLAERLAADRAARPLLAGDDDLRARIAQLLAERAPHYAGFSRTLDTGGQTPASAAAALAARLDLPHATLEIPVPGPEGLPALAARGVTTSAVVSGRGAACNLGRHLRDRGIDGRVVLAMPAVVREHHGARLQASLEAAGLAHDVLTIRDGDREKTLDQVGEILARLADLGCDRGTCLVAAGGGVTGDLVGLAAALYMRGLGLVMVPTTLLAQVDAHLGGKTGVNGAGAKNLAGAFWPPLLVVSDPCLLATLPDRELAGGYAEVVKTALIGDPGLLDRLEERLVSDEAPSRAGTPGGEAADARGACADPRRDPALLEACATACAAVKGGVVGRDPWELGERRVLNLGHTLGHALEAQSAFGLSHGEAVAIGLVAALRLAVTRGMVPVGLLDRTRRLLAACGLPTVPPAFDPDDLRARLRLDKKRVAGRLRFVLPRAAGEVVVVDDVTEDEALAALAEERTCASS